MIIGDSAYPPASYPTSFDGKPVEGWCVYIGGNTPHVWTEQEIAHLKSQPWCRYLLPIFVRSNPAGASASADAAAAVQWAQAHGQPRGTLVMWDYEMAVDSAYEMAVDRALQALAGLHEVLYGSKSTVIQNTRPSGGYDEAGWTGADYAPSDTADQFGSWSAYDLGEFAANAALWDLRPPAPTSPPPIPSEDEMEQSRDGFVTFSWSEGERHIVQVAFDEIGGNQPELRAVLFVEPGGPLVLAGDDKNPPWKPDHTLAGKVLRFPVLDNVRAYGLELQPIDPKTPARYAASVS